MFEQIFVGYSVRAIDALNREVGQERGRETGREIEREIGREIGRKIRREIAQLWQQIVLSSLFTPCRLRGIYLLMDDMENFFPSLRLGRSIFISRSQLFNLNCQIASFSHLHNSFSISRFSISIASPPCSVVLWSYFKFRGEMGVPFYMVNFNEFATSVL